jgi:hypothetical protein
VSEYEQQIYRMAQVFAEVAIEEEGARQHVRTAEGALNRVRDRLDNAEKDLRNCVGSNMPERFVDLPQGVVQITQNFVKLRPVIRKS